MFNLKYKKDRRRFYWWCLTFLFLYLFFSFGSGEKMDRDILGFNLIDLSLLYIVIIYPIYFLRNRFRSYLTGGDVYEGYSDKFKPKTRANSLVREITNGYLNDKQEKKAHEELDYLIQKYKEKFPRTKAEMLEGARESMIRNLDRMEKANDKWLKDNQERLHVDDKGELASKIKCPHCNETGYVRRKVEKVIEESKEKGIIGGIIGKKMVTDKGEITKLFCDNCGTPWTA